jgi:hypothetical protein
MKQFFCFIAFTICTTAVYSQRLDPKYNRDSLFNALVMKLPEPKRQQYKEGYITSGVKDKDFYIYILNMPVSSKDALVNNISRKKAKINELVKSYNALVPKGYSVFIEFNPEDKLFSIPASIDLHITQGAETDTGNDLPYGSAELNKKLATVGWNTQTLDAIKKLLANAGCISIENNEVTIVGFARSGMGKYGFLVFPKVLNNKEITEYNDGCHYIYHENNLVLTYGGGAVGPDCFPD